MIPVYNTAPYLKRCLDSVFSQTYSNLEVVLVEDCSTDNSLSLLKEILPLYQPAVPPVLVERPRNGGSAVARMDALAAAHGEWLLSLDSDDFWDNEQVVAQWMQCALDTQAEVVVSDYYTDYPRYTRLDKVPHLPTGRDFVLGLLTGTTPGFMWNKLILRSTFERIKEPWVPGLNIFEDLSAMVPFFFHIDRVAYLGLPTCHYVQSNAGSYTHNIDMKKVNGMTQVLERVEELLSTLRLDDPELDHAIPLIYWTPKRMLLEHAPVRDYRAIAAIHPEINSRVWEVPVSFYNRCMLYCQTVPPLFYAGRALALIKQWIKCLVRH